MHRSTFVFLVLLVPTLVLTASTATAAPPDAQTIVERMKAALEPDRSSTRDVLMVTSTGGATVQWSARQARKKLKDGKRMLTVLLAPADVKGFALLIWERRDKDDDAQWLYMPFLRRVREILPVATFESFMGTDFTTSDLGFINLRHRKFSLLGEEKLGKEQTYKVQEVLDDPRYYSRIVTWVAADSMLPMRREYYDVANTLWKTELFEDVKSISGVPAPLRIRMQDNQTGTSTEIRESNVRYDAKIPDSLFDPQRLPETVKQKF
jgi:outer membrane lipoprotein-sorting protein